ncbi:helix-turn-helix domain-containing protein [Synoicihabitans lomoniglobus]|uniref:Helix-turn-helix domain-containing protein n=1 Tax=Synoicihabitans lomoniglobus TaxID=2909285 RepID=A0AAF0I3H2_9BACT|nr:helix-turn-helix domain-containing protein [Opitutaceae bacterium LMO-M01]WED66313.1 helix-turn-helix domain-containing protein [Opitutaceae bacterium LMO-M01]
MALEYKKNQVLDRAVMVTDKIKELQALQAKAAELQKSIEVERTQELAALPAKFGYDLPGFLKAVKAAAGSKTRGRKAKASAAPSGKRTRTKITPELKAKVKAAVEAGKTGSAIASEFGISVPSVQNIKKEFGLVKERSAPTPAAAPAPAPAPTES